MSRASDSSAERCRSVSLTPVTVKTMTLAPCLTDSVRSDSLPECAAWAGPLILAASPSPLTSVLVMPGTGIVIRAQAVAGRTTMLTRCELPTHRQPVVPSGVGGATEAPSTWPISVTVKSLHGSAAITARGNVDNSPNAASAPHRCADISRMHFPRFVYSVLDFCQYHTHGANASRSQTAAGAGPS